MGRICKLTHTVLFLWLSCTKPHHYNAVSCKALFFFLMSKRNTNMLAKSWLMSCWHAVWHIGANIFWWNVWLTFSIFPTPRCMSGRHVIWGIWWHKKMPTFSTKCSLQIWILYGGNIYPTTYSEGGKSGRMSLWKRCCVDSYVLVLHGSHLSTWSKGG